MRPSTRPIGAFSTATCPINGRRILRPGGLFVFLEPETVASIGTVELVSRIFPATVKDRSAAGRKSRYGGGDSNNAEEVDSSESSEAKEGADRVGIVSQMVDTLFVRYITGIAVRP